MNSVKGRLTGINTWFIIEILSFYGYILSAVVYIVEHSLKSSAGFPKKQNDSDPLYKHDFIAYNRKDLDWAAFVQILFNVNICLMALDYWIIFKNEIIDSEVPYEEHPHPLKHVTKLLLFNHLLQMIFLKSFFDENNRVNTRNKWVWVTHLISYSYVAYIYAFTDARFRERS